MTLSELQTVVYVELPIVRAVIRESVASDTEVDDELRDLRKYFS